MDESTNNGNTADSNKKKNKEGFMEISENDIDESNNDSANSDKLINKIPETKAKNLDNNFVGEGRHLVILCHGFQGSSHDVRLLRNNLLLLFPSSITFCSRINEDDTECSIEEMGKKLAKEI